MGLIRAVDYGRQYSLCWVLRLREVFDPFPIQQAVAASVVQHLRVYPDGYRD